MHAVAAMYNAIIIEEPHLEHLNPISSVKISIKQNLYFPIGSLCQTKKKVTAINTFLPP